MADKKISALTAATTPLAGTEVLPIVQSGTTVKVSVANLTAGRSTLVSELISDDGVQGRWTLTQDASGNGLFSSTPGFGGWRSARLQANGTGPNMTWGADGNTTVGVGNLVMGTAGRGIDFSANTHAPGMTSELLDWYEEGAWTPSVGGSATYTTQLGSYTRVGNLVTVHFDLQINNIGTGSLTTIYGLPFQVGARTACGSVGFFNGLSQNIVSLYIRADSNTSEIICTALTAANSGVGGATNLLTSASRIIGSLTYSV